MNTYREDVEQNREGVTSRILSKLCRLQLLNFTCLKMYISQSQRRKKVMISILFFVIKAACPDEEEKFQTIKKLIVWGKFQPNPSWLSNSTVWKSRRKTASGIPVAQPSFYRIEQIPGKRGPAPVLELSGLCFLWNSGMKSIRRERFTTGAI